MVQALLCRPTSGDVNVKADSAQVHSHLHLLTIMLRMRMVGGWVQYARPEPFNKVRDAIAFGFVDGYCTMESAIVQERAAAHLRLAKQDSQLQEGLGVVVCIEEREAAGEKCQEDDAGGPDVQGGRLILTFQENLGSAETTSSGSICSNPRSGVVLSQSYPVDLSRWAHDT